MTNSDVFKAFSWQFVKLIVQAEMALGSPSSPMSVKSNFDDIDNNLGSLLLTYGKIILAKKAPEGWEDVYHQILDNLDPKMLPFSLKDRNPECIALLKYCESTEFYDPILDGLLGAFKYDQMYFDKIISSILPLLNSCMEGNKITYSHQTLFLEQKGGGRKEIYVG